AGKPHRQVFVSSKLSETIDDASLAADFPYLGFNCRRQPFRSAALANEIECSLLKFASTHLVHGWDAHNFLQQNPRSDQWPSQVLAEITRGLCFTGPNPAGNNKDAIGQQVRFVQYFNSRLFRHS